MMRLVKDWRSAALGMSIAVAVMAALLLVQRQRSAWPFRARPTPPIASQTSPAGQPPAGMPDMPGMPGMSGKPGDHAQHDRKGTPAPKGYAPITIDPERAGGLQIKTVTVEERAFDKRLRTVGVVALDETRTAHVHSKVRGWIDGIFVNFIGRKVKQGEPLCSIYSQEVYAAEIELLSVAERASPPGGKDGPRAAEPLLEAARRRLTLWDVPESEITRLESSRQARRTFPLLASRSGTVVAKEAIEGLYVDPSIELYTLSDLSTVWVLADVYEANVPSVHVGDTADLAIEGTSGTLKGKVAFLHPTLDEATRTLKVRFVLDNRAGRLRPGAFVNLTMNLGLGRGLEVPESAVIRTGTRAIVFVVHGERGEHFEPREIQIGPQVGERYRVTGGLSAGERVAVGAQFLLDSESRLRASSAPGGGHAH